MRSTVATLRCSAVTLGLLGAVWGAGCSSSETHVTTTATDAGADAGATTVDVAQYVNPLIGTRGGETWPGADTPFGMLQWSPENTAGDQTRSTSPGGYSYDHAKIRGFGLTHMSGTGCAGAFGDIPFFPHPGTVTKSPSADSTDAIYASTFSHENELAQAGYYSVNLDSGVLVELTATTRTGSGRFTYPEDQPATMLLRSSNSEVGSEDAHIEIDAENRVVTGWVKSGNFCGYIFGTAGNVDRHSYYTLHFRAEFDRPIIATGTWKDATVTSGATAVDGGTTYGNDGFPPAGKGSGAWLTFDTGGLPVGVRVGISFVSQENAKANLDAENPEGTSFETVKQGAYDAWNRSLGRVEVSGGGTPDELSTFYTSVYHSLMHPNVFSDVNGQYVGMDQATHTLEGGQKAQYANFSGWDVYRGQLQLVALLEPEIAGDIAQSLLNQANQNGGVWDRWTHAAGGTHVMAGDPGHIVVPTIYAFGGTNFDAGGALTSMVHAATTPTAEDRSRDGWNVMSVGERPSLDQYLSLHYVPADGNAWGGAGETLEDVAADFAISQLAERLGDSATHGAFLARSDYWRNVFNPAASGTEGYIQDRLSDGTWSAGFTPATDTGFAEGSSAQYTWMIPFNPRGLFDALGGNEHALARLDDFFHVGTRLAVTKAGATRAELDNEPSIGAPFMYAFAGAPHKTQEIVREVVNTLWKNAPDGIPGQDDLGAMSAWYAWSALGLYPQYPGRAELLVVAPLFPKVVIHRSNGVVLTIAAPEAGTKVPFVQSLRVNGQESSKAWLPESFIGADGQLDFTVSETANVDFGASASDVPPSFAP